MTFSPSPFGGQNRAKLTKKEYTQGILGTIFLIILIVFYVKEFQYFSNTFQVKSLVIRSIIAGGIIGALIAFQAAKKYTNAHDKFTMYPFFMILLMVFAPFFGSMTNRVFSFQEKQNIEVIYHSKSIFAKSRFGFLKGEKITPNGGFLFFIKDQKIERVKTNVNYMPDAKEGDRISIVTRKGFWGYEYFLEE